jgi:diguanylate cyclase (GGDEF)-like protein/PAS domain S-box-containing protein
MLRDIRSRLLALVLATVVPFVALIGAGLWIQWRSEHDAALQRAQAEARLLAAQLDDHIGNLDNLLVGLSQAVSFDPADLAANDALLARTKAQLPGFISNILLFAPDGSNLGLSWHEDGPRMNARDRLYFRRVLAGDRLGVGDVIHSLANGEFVVSVARPLEDAAGQLRGVLVIGTRLEHFQDALRVSGLPAGSVVRIVNEKGVVIAHTGNAKEWIGQDLSRLRDVARHLMAGEISEVIHWSDGVERITGSATANRVPWLVSVGLPTDIAYATVASQLGWSVLFSAGALIAAFAIAWVLSARIVRPLRQLRNDASALAAGDLAHRTAIATPDEVGELAETFNHMAASLQHRHEDAARAAEEMRRAKDTLSAVIDASPVAIVCSDHDRRIMLWSRAAEQMFGHSAAETVGQRTKLVPPEGVAHSQALFDRAMGGETLRDVQATRMRKDGSLVEVRIAAARMHDVDGAVRGVAWAYEDITDRKRAEEQLEHLAHFDQLTGLPNRLSLQRELRHLLESGASARATSVALFDLDGFKDVNDTLGHSVGDQLLIEVGRRLAAVADDRARVCRLGGDEFVAIVPGCGDPRAVGDIIDRMLRRLGEPFEISDHVLHVGGSAGIAIAPNDGTNADELLANADLALYRAKADGGRGYRFFLPALRAQAQARRELGGELRRAFAQHEFELYFQPQVRLADEAVVGAEALLRWHHPVRGILGPGAFIEALAESPMAQDVGAWILQTACRNAAAWRAAGLALGRIGVNLFPSHLHSASFIHDVDGVLRGTGLPAEVLELEITENVALNYEDPASSLHQLHDRGVQLAFDDFGTGYASLSYLTRFPLSRIKIDRCFVSRMNEDGRDAAIVRSLIAMAHNLGLSVIAEGVESEAQAAFLRAEQCDEAQGFLFAKPLTAGAFAAYLATASIAELSAAPPAPEPAATRARPVRVSGRRKFRS